MSGTSPLGTLDGMSIYEITPTATTFLADEYGRWGHHGWSPWFLVVGCVFRPSSSGRSGSRPALARPPGDPHAARRVRQGQGQRGRIPRASSRAEGNPPLATALTPRSSDMRLVSPAASAIRCRGFTRGVAQLGSALRSGRRGRGFESRHPDSVMSQDIRVAVNLRLGSQLFLWAATSVVWTAPLHQSITGFGNQLAIQVLHLSRHCAIASDFGVDFEPLHPPLG